MTREEWLAICDRDSRVARGFRLRSAAKDRRALIATVRELVKAVRAGYYRDDQYGIATAATAPFEDSAIAGQS